MSRSRLFLLFVAVLGLLGLATVPGRAEGGLPTDGTPLCKTVGSGPAEDDGELKVGTFNLLHAQSSDGNESLLARLPLQAEAIIGADADIVGLQEVHADDERGNIAELLAGELSARTGEAWHWCWSYSNPHFPLTPEVLPMNPLDDAMVTGSGLAGQGEFREGVGVVSRYPVAEKRFRRLAPRSYEAPACVANTSDPLCAPAAVFDSRQVLWALIEAPGRDVDLFTSHIAHGLTPLSDVTKRVHVEQSLAVIDEWSSDDDLRFFVGDFNSEPGSDRYQAVVDAGFLDTYEASGALECDPETGLGGCTGGPDEGKEAFGDNRHRRMHGRIDYVWVKPPGRCTATASGSEVIGEKATRLPPPDRRWLWPSDHLGVVSHTTLACT